MPHRLKKPCAYPGCPELVQAEQTYCNEHKRKVKGQRDKEYNRQRDPRSRKFYGSARWKKLRNKYIKQNPLCEHCQEKDKVTAATEVDHIIPIEVDWSRRLEWNNLQSLCHRCHMQKTQEDKKKYNE